jgi:hypothetical protein
MKLSIQEATNSDMSITCKEGVMPYDHSTYLDTYLNLGVRVYSIGATTAGSDAELRRHGR